MPFGSVKNLVASVVEATPAQFDDWRKAWRAAADSGSTEPLLSFVARERGLAEDVFLQRLATTLGWPFLDLHTHTIRRRRGIKFPRRSRFNIPSCRRR